MGTSTPWGPAQDSTPYGRGIVFYGTAGHGGFHVSPTLNALMPEALRLPSGWYEEDCEYARVILAFPERFDPERVKAARESLRTWAPEDFEKLTGKVVMPGESYVRDEDIFRAENKERMITLAASGSGAGRSMATPGGPVPEGMVEVFAGRGGRLESGRYPAETAYYLVPEAEYDNPARGSFVIDEGRHALVRGGR